MTTYGNTYLKRLSHESVYDNVRTTSGGSESTLFILKKMIHIMHLLS